jgi:hypothetical protein
VFGNKKVSVKVQYVLKGAMSGDVRETVVQSDSIHKGEVEMALAEKLGLDSYFDVTAVGTQVVK